MPASVDIRGSTFTNILCFQCNFSQGEDVVREQAKCSAGAPWLVCGPTSANFANGYSVQYGSSHADLSIGSMRLLTRRRQPQGGQNAPNLVFVTLISRI